jgi:hypothetical protein
VGNAFIIAGVSKSPSRVRLSGALVLLEDLVDFRSEKKPTSLTASGSGAVSNLLPSYASFSVFLRHMVTRIGACFTTMMNKGVGQFMIFIEVIACCRC